MPAQQAPQEKELLRLFICVKKTPECMGYLDVLPLGTVSFTYPPASSRQDMDGTKFKLEAWIDWTNLLDRLTILPVASKRADWFSPVILTLC